jgi:TonB family protein
VTILKKVTPKYPSDARIKGIEGKVRVSVLVNKQGVPEKLTVISGPPELISASLDALRQWRYKPLKLNGKAVPVEASVDINYVIPANAKSAYDSPSTGAPAASPCSVGRAASGELQPKINREPKQQKRSGVQQESNDPCGSNSVSSSTPPGSESVGWDPVTDWDGPNSREIVGFFVLGLFVCAPVFVLVQRLRTRKSESEAANRVLK